MVTLLSLALLLAALRGVDPSLMGPGYSQLQLHTPPGHVDTWTRRETGCACPDTGGLACPCCNQGGCPCPRHGRCVQCGLEAACAGVCNLTIASTAVTRLSGRGYGEVKSGPGARGPLACRIRLVPQPGERVELHVYRLLRIGSLDPATHSCSGGGLEVAPYPRLCGENGRYSPPVVMFGRPGAAATAQLLVTEITPRTQWLLHYSFTRAADPALGTKMTGARLQQGQGCEYRYTECWGRGCHASSPGYPGIYPAHARCRYVVEAGARARTRVRLRVSTNLPAEPGPAAGGCSDNFVKVSTSSEAGPGQEVARLCGAQEQELTLTLRRQGRAVIEFSSGPAKPPFVHNGFVAEIKFLGSKRNKDPGAAAAEEKRDLAEAAKTERQQSARDYQTPKLEPRHLLVQQDDAILKYNGDNIVEAITRPTKILGRPRQLPEVPEVETFRCHQEVTEPHRSGFIQSAAALAFAGNGSQCSLVFRGEQRDVVTIGLDTLVLSGANCSSQLRLSIQDPSQPRGLRTVRTFCSPLQLRPGAADQDTAPLVIEASLVFLDFFTVNQTHDMFSGAFSFHNTLLEGRPVAGSRCSVAVSGAGLSWLPKLEGAVAAPPVSPLLWGVAGPLSCSTHLNPDPAHSQAVRVTVTESHWPGAGGCVTSCDGLGCVCSEPGAGASLALSWGAGASNHCLCGDLQKYLPLSLSGPGPVTAVYTAPHYTFQEARGSGLLRLAAKYEFLRVVRAECGQRVYNTSSGLISRPGAPTLLPSPGPGQHSAPVVVQEECEWVVSPPPSSALAIVVDTSAVTNVSCTAWQLRLWTVDKMTGARESVDLMCGQDARREYTVPRSFARILHIAVSSLHPRPLNYSLAWNTSGPLLPDSLQFEKEAGGQRARPREDSLQVVGVGGMGGLDLTSGAARSGLLGPLLLLLVVRLL